MEEKYTVVVLSMVLAVGTILPLPTYAVEQKPEGIEAVRYVQEERFSPPAYPPEGMPKTSEDESMLTRQRIREWALTHRTLLEEWLPCDFNRDGRTTIVDAAYLVDFIYRDGSAPFGHGDANSDGRISIADAIYIASYLYRGGRVPCNPPAAAPSEEKHMER